MICKKCGGTEFESSNFHGHQVDVCTNCLETYSSYTNEEEHNQYIQEEKNKKFQESLPPTATCPYCKSTSTKKISGTSRWLSTGFWGIASSKVGKQWHCTKCGSDF